MTKDIDGNKIKVGDKVTLPKGDAQYCVAKIFLGNYIQFEYGENPVMASKFRLVKDKSCS